MTVERHPRPSAFLLVACLYLLVHAVQFLGLALVAGYGGAVEDIELELMFGGRVPLTPSYLWLVFLPAGLASVVAVWKEAHRPHGGPALAASIVWMVIGVLVAADVRAPDPIITSGAQLLIAGIAFVRTRSYREAMSGDPYLVS